MRIYMISATAVLALVSTVGCGKAPEAVSHPAAASLAISTLIGREGNTLRVRTDCTVAVDSVDQLVVSVV